LYQGKGVGPSFSAGASASFGSGVSLGWLALVLVLFCLPLFIGLDGEDIREDEAIYSFAVDRILETGDWLEPKSIPNETYPFLEKPPLKFWIVAAPMRWGLLPHNEFGMRFWDALFGGLSFVYVFLIGSLLLGPVCGAVAVLVLFAHEPLLFLHGLRGNNMEAPLVLAYCGGMYHFMAWAQTVRLKPDTTPAGVRAYVVSGFSRTFEWRATLHALAVGLYFVLGFMTKFLAAIFLPMVLGAAALLVSDYRRKVLRHWRLWAAVIVVVFALIAPWFVWVWRRYGELLWKFMFSEAIVTRMTAYLDPMHVQPWSFYPVTLHRWLAGSGTFWLVVAGLLVLAIQSVKRRWAEGFLVLLWFVLPMIAISLGTSKLYHYTYPFLPPLALAAGYLVALALAVGHAPVGRALAAAEHRFVWMWRHGALRLVYLAVAVTALAIAVVTMTKGPIDITSGSREIFKSSGIVRPLAVALVFGLLGGIGWRAPRLVTGLLVLSVLPLTMYRQSFLQLSNGSHPMRAARDCINHVQASTAVSPGMYVDVPPPRMPYPHYYYFRTVRPWVRTEAPAPEKLRPYLGDPVEQRPVLVWAPTYMEFRRGIAPEGTAGGSAPALTFIHVDDVLLLLPGPYAACAVGGPSPTLG
jgi:4-amino-4-deoxy-L-arabinose transferase-like glycosyltransferase